MTRGMKVAAAAVSAMISKFGAPTDEQKRIADILERAAKEIRGE